MKILAFFMSLCLSFNLLASTTRELEAAMDEYQYALSVEWNQQDKDVFEKHTEEFFSKMESLIQSGLTKNDIQSLAANKIQNPAALMSLEMKLAALSSAHDSHDLASALESQAQDFYAKGASWNGETVVAVAAGGVILAVLAYQAWYYSNHECVGYETRSNCSMVGKCREQQYCSEYVKKENQTTDIGF